MTAERFANQRFAFSLSTLSTVQVPAVATVIGRELGIGGVLLVGAGLIAAARRRSLAAGLVFAAAVGMLVMVVNLRGDTNGFITPAMTLLVAARRLRHRCHRAVAAVLPSGPRCRGPWPGGAVAAKHPAQPRSRAVGGRDGDPHQRASTRTTPRPTRAEIRIRRVCCGRCSRSCRTERRWWLKTTFWIPRCST